jgi:hypothetical protein
MKTIDGLVEVSAYLKKPGDLIEYDEASDLPLCSFGLFETDDEEGYVVPNDEDEEFPHYKVLKPFIAFSFTPVEWGISDDRSDFLLEYEIGNAGWEFLIQEKERLIKYTEKITTEAESLTQKVKPLIREVKFLVALSVWSDSYFNGEGTEYDAGIDIVGLIDTSRLNDLLIKD